MCAHRGVNPAVRMHITHTLYVILRMPTRNTYARLSIEIRSVHARALAYNARPTRTIRSTT